MNEKKKLVPLLDPRVYQFMWKGDHAQEYLSSFISSYFKLNGLFKIEDFEIIDEKLIKDNSEDKIYVTFTSNCEKYYYEVKFTNKNNASKYFDFSFLPFARYCWSLQNSNIHIGQMIIDFQDKNVTQPIFCYTMKNSEIKEDRGIEIHALSVPILSDILCSKSASELNLFERWILLLSGKKVCDIEMVLDDYDVLKLFYYLWSGESNQILIEDSNKSEKLQLAYILSHLQDKTPQEIAYYLLEHEFSVNCICEATGLSILEIENLRKK